MCIQTSFSERAIFSQTEHQKSRSCRFRALLLPERLACSWLSGQQGFTCMGEQRRSCCHHHSSRSTGVPNSILQFGCAVRAEQPLPSTWCNCHSFWNDPSRLFTAQRPLRILMLLFILVRNLGQELIILCQVTGRPASWPGSQPVSILFLGYSQ